MDRGVACGAKGPGFDSSFILMDSSLASKGVGWNQA